MKSSDFVSFIVDGTIRTGKIIAKYARPFELLSGYRYCIVDNEGNEYNCSEREVLS